MIRRAAMMFAFRFTFSLEPVQYLAAVIFSGNFSARIVEKIAGPAAPIQDFSAILAGKGLKRS
jgi:hypothetical protein